MVLTLLILISSLIIIAIIALPFVVRAVVNKALRKMDGYIGQLDRLQINLVKSTIQLQDIRISKDTDLEHASPVLLIPAITIGFKWKPLLRKILDLNIVVNHPQALFVAEELLPPEDTSSTHSRELQSLKNSIEKLTAFRITLDVRDGTVRYVNRHSKLDITVRELNFAIHNFSNRAALSNSCRIIGKGLLYEGRGAVEVTLLPLEPTLTMDLNLELQSINLVLLNHLLIKYGKVDLTKGTLDLYAEVAVAGNSFKGYVKPLLKDLDFISAEDRGDNLFRKVWERLIAGFYNILENNRSKQVVAKIPLEGRLDDPHVRVGVVMMSILRNAFVKALTPSFDDIINFSSIWNPKETNQKAERNP